MNQIRHLQFLFDSRLTKRAARLFLRENVTKILQTTVHSKTLSLFEVDCFSATPFRIHEHEGFKAAFPPITQPEFIHLSEVYPTT